MNPIGSDSKDGSLAMSRSAGAGGTGKTDICHIPPGNPANAHTISVGNPAVSAHLDHGDVIGRCEDDRPAKTNPCADNPGQSKEKDAMALSSSEGKVAVCHIPPGNPANAHTILVGEAAVKAHLDHGDQLGACPAVDEGGSEGDSDCGGTGTEGGTESGTGSGTGTDPLPPTSGEFN